MLASTSQLHVMGSFNTCSAFCIVTNIFVRYNPLIFSLTKIKINTINPAVFFLQFLLTAIETVTKIVFETRTK